MDLIIHTSNGLYCPPGDFYIDPWRPVSKAVITHAHADHACRGSTHYLAVDSAANLLKIRLGSDIQLQTQPYYQPLIHNGVMITFFPSGHILGSAQISVRYQAQHWVVSGDYKIEADNTCAAFEPVMCDVFITESTFGLPIYYWPPQQQIFREIVQWWQACKNDNKNAVLMAYSLGKAQRILAGITTVGLLGPIIVHGSLLSLNQAYTQAGVKLPPTQYLSADTKPPKSGGALVIAPPSVQNTPWLRKFGSYEIGFASGWMQIRGIKRRKNLDRGFVLSDHADWPGLLNTIHQTQAAKILVTHGYSNTLAHYLNRQGIAAAALQTEFTGETIETDNAVISTNASEISKFE